MQPLYAQLDRRKLTHLRVSTRLLDLADDHRKIVDANKASSESSCVLDSKGESCVWAVNLAPSSDAQLVVTSNGTDYALRLGIVECATGCVAFASVCDASSSSSSSASASSSPISHLPSSSSSTTSRFPSSSPSSSTSDHSSKPQTTPPLDQPSETSSAKTKSKMKTKFEVSTAPPSEITTTDEMGRTTTIFVPGEVVTNPVVTVEDDTEKKGLSTGAVAAIASVGSVAGVALLIGCWWAFRKSARRQEELELEDTILFGPRPSTAADPFLGIHSNATSFDAEEVLGPAARQRTSAYGGPGIASTFPARYTDPYDEPSSPRMRSRSAEASSRPSSLVQTSRPSSLVRPSEGAVTPRYADDDIAEFITTGSPRATARSLAPRPQPSTSSTTSERPRSWVDADVMHAERKRVSKMKSEGKTPTLTRVPSQRRGSSARGSRVLDGASEPLLRR